MDAVTVHFATEYTTGDQSVPTACGKTVSTWNDEPDRGTSNEPDVTCNDCLRWLVPHLRASLDDQAKRNIELMHDRLAGKIPGLGVHGNERKAMDRVIEAARAANDLVRPGGVTHEEIVNRRCEVSEAIAELDRIRAEKNGSR